jgi:hypothetical protein
MGNCLYRARTEGDFMPETESAWKIRELIISQPLKKGRGYLGAVNPLFHS